MNMMGVINLDNEKDFLNELTYFRCGAAVPFAGRYRLIDFVLSSMTNAHLNEIAVFTRSKYRSLNDHLGKGKCWDLDIKHGGLFILPPDWNDPTDISKGDLQHFHNNLDFFHRSKAEYVIISGSQHVCNVDYEDAYQQHLQSGADVTVIYKKVDRLETEHKQCQKLDVQADGRVLEITNEEYNNNIYMNMYIINKSFLLQLLEEGIAYGASHFFNDCIASKVKSLNIQAYEYTGVHSVINSVESYYKGNLQLLDRKFYQDLFDKELTVFTKVKDEPPAKYLHGSKVTNSIVGNGCVIEGTVENSILFRGVKVEKGAVIKNSIIMQRGVIKEGSVMEHVILDKDVSVTNGKRLIGNEQIPFVIPKRKVI
ncbi:glucose-1-phosphate adenylyltransferase subunit GlgD [Anaerobacillus arseniciselenatis]|uniref:Glucose-1-phosphate adenylyltransferase subunit GlgD n=1 Tax=Anaerobacillus arseniciselenatis TaxID=85682 RepID=A0A1S2LSV5_9BACI|nr:glucose-1-phosphate adenylyltransferase subunit GlgD [Anaerobacillus arseniciselenatis]OIJ15290.1 glucose-1-phosphate adenylyltransferase subunit GlgD [Anaerobacillus arseniciselenatis]